jgi:hypothetical protein
LAVDDSTSRIVGAYFAEKETTLGYFEVLRQIIEDYGVPKDFYTDRCSSFEFRSGKTDIDKTIQFRRVCHDFGIGIITTSIPQAKGRVERANRTMQDRLISEMRLNKIKTMEEANLFLNDFVVRFNERFALANKNSCFSEAPDERTLNKLICYKYPKKILSGNVISHKCKQYLPTLDSKVVIIPENETVSTIETYDGKLMILHNEIYYDVKKIADSGSTAHKPSGDHPWRQKGVTF